MTFQRAEVLSRELCLCRNIKKYDNFALFFAAWFEYKQSTNGLHQDTLLTMAIIRDIGTITVYWKTKLI